MAVRIQQGQARGRRHLGWLWTPIVESTLPNGAVAHALDYNDCGMEVNHPTTLALPMVLTLDDGTAISGQVGKG